MHMFAFSGGVSTVFLELQQEFYGNVHDIFSTDLGNSRTESKQQSL